MDLAPVSPRSNIYIYIYFLLFSGDATPRPAPVFSRSGSKPGIRPGSWDRLALCYVGMWARGGGGGCCGWSGVLPCFALCSLLFDLRVHALLPSQVRESVSVVTPVRRGTMVMVMVNRSHKKTHDRCQTDRPSAQLEPSSSPTRSHPQLCRSHLISLS